MHYWVISPYDSQQPHAFANAWEYDKRNNTIAVGWGEMGDVAGLSQPELRERYQRAYGERPAGVITRDCNTLWALYHEVAPGDKVIARRGTKRLIGVGTVCGPVHYDESKGRDRVGGLAEHAYPNFTPVNWESTEELELDRALSFYTMYQISEEDFRSLVGTSAADGSQERIEFGLEKTLENFLVENFSVIFGDELNLYCDLEGNTGQQYPVIAADGKQIGKIDILAVDAKTGDYVVMELKKGQESDKVVGQVLRYIGWVQEALCKEGQGARGLVITGKEDEKLRYAIRPVAHFVQVRHYRVRFELVDPLGSKQGA